MTIRTESRIKIASSVREVWAYVCDVGRWPEWAPTVLECRVRGGAPLQPGSLVEQRAKGILWLTRGRSQEVTAAEAPRYVAFAGPMGTSAARWGMELEPVDDRQTDAKMWIEVDLAGIMHAIPGRFLKGRIQRVSDRERAAIKAAGESAARGGAESEMGWRALLPRRHRDRGAHREPHRPHARAPDRDVPQEGEALRHHLPALPGARLPPARTTPPGRTSTRPSRR